MKNRFHLFIQEDPKLKDLEGIEDDIAHYYWALSVRPCSDIPYLAQHEELAIHPKEISLARD